MAYGLRPISHGGYSYNTAGNEVFPIVDNANEIGHGDIVKFNASGGIVQQTTSPTGLCIVATGNVTIPGNQILGVFVGCRYTDNNGTPTWAQYYPGSGSTNAAEAQEGFVVTDPNAVFQVSANSGAAAVWNVTAIGQVFALANLDVSPSGTGKSGNSGATIADLSSPVSTATVGGAVRVIGVVKDGKNESTSTTPNVIVRWADPSVLHYGYGLGV